MDVMKTGNKGTNSSGMTPMSCYKEESRSGEPESRSGDEQQVVHFQIRTRCPPLRATVLPVEATLFDGEGETVSS